MTALTLDQIVAHTTTLPRLPAAAMRLVGVLGDPDSSLDEIVESIRFDQTITAELLRYCNSAYLGVPREVRSLDEAIRFLGTAKVLQLAMAAHAQSLLSRSQSGYGLPPGALWKHSVGVALAAQRLGALRQSADRGALFTAGLLHDVGKIVLNEFVGAEYARIAARVEDERMSFEEAEAAVLGFTHAEVGARLAESWGLPAPIVRCIRHHYRPDELAPPDLLVDLTHLADCICLMMGVGGGDDGTSYRALPQVIARIGVDARDFERVGAEVVLELKAVESQFAQR